MLNIIIIMRRLSGQFDDPKKKSGAKKQNNII